MLGRSFLLMLTTKIVCDDEVNCNLNSINEAGPYYGSEDYELSLYYNHLAEGTINLRFYPFRPDVYDQVNLACGIEAVCFREIIPRILNIRLSVGLVDEGIEKYLKLSFPDPPKDSSVSYSSFRCLGGSQKLTTNYLRNNHPEFPLNDPRFRVCRLRNVCFTYKTDAHNLPPTLVYFRREYEDKQKTLSDEFSFQTMAKNIVAGQLSFKRILSDSASRKFTFMPVVVVDHGYDTNKFQTKSTIFLDEPSWPNYGHYLIDNVIPTYMAAEMFGIKFTKIQQLYLSSCTIMKQVNPYGNNVYCQDIKGRPCSNFEFCLH